MSGEGSDVSAGAEEAPAEVVDAEVVPHQESVSSPGAPAPISAETGYTPGGVPTFDYARQRIENRYGAAVGAAELAAETPEGRTAQEQYEARQQAAAERLAQIRESMRDDRPGDA